MKTGVLVHGCHLEAYDWRGIAWGYPDRNELGRIPKGVLVALETNADLLVFGTGASCRLVEEDGQQIVKREGEYTLGFLLRRFEELAEFKAFEGVDLAALRKRVEGIAVADVDSMNTEQEVRNAARMFLRQGIEGMVLVSSPTHLPRCLRDACAALVGEEFRSLRQHLLATPSDSCYLGSRAENVVIFEPPHRADRHSQPLHLNAQRLLRIPEHHLDRFLKRLDGILQEEFQV
ncbi:MAG: hypothetical protein DWQ01_09220 [Planctomycetota bacterium]|nr:MAG: hypothetical protein DWQ01_09220 [Planctomycetota bacterium]